MAQAPLSSGALAWLTANLASSELHIYIDADSKGTPLAVEVRFMCCVHRCPQLRFVLFRLL